MNLNLPSSLIILIDCQWSWKCRSNPSCPKKGLYPEKVHSKRVPICSPASRPEMTFHEAYQSLPLPFPGFSFHYSWKPWALSFSHTFTSPSIRLPPWPSIQSILLIPQIWINSTICLLFCSCVIVLNYTCHGLNCVLLKLIHWSPKSQWIVFGVRSNKG